MLKFIVEYIAPILFFILILVVLKVTTVIDTIEFVMFTVYALVFEIIDFCIWRKER